MLAALLAAAAMATATPPLPAAPALDVPAGWRAEVYATNVPRATALAWGPGRLLYATQDTGEVVAIGRGSARPRVVARGLETPLGLAWIGRTAYVSARGALWRYRLAGKVLTARRALLSGLPYGRHQQDNVVVGRDGRLYLGSGSTCDACQERDRRSATVLSLRPDGRDLRIEATGLRNPFGLVVQPSTGRIFVSVNNRDDLGRAEPAEAIVVLRRGANYGWPGCWPGWVSRRLEGSCAGVTAPLALLEPHSSANGMAFVGAALYVAEWGQYLSEEWGRKLVRVDPRTGRVSDFVDGFEHPLAVLADGDRAMLVSDWGRGVIYRVARTGAG